MRTTLLIVAAFVLGVVVGWKRFGRPPSVPVPRHGMVSYPTGDGGRKTVQLTFIPIKTDARGDVDLGPGDWWIEIGGRAYAATTR